MRSLIEETFRTIVMRPIDSVAVALQDMPPGTEVRVRVSTEVSDIITLVDGIGFGHKFAIRPIKTGETIYKYGEIIGKASRDINIGEHVHVHNLEGTRGRGDKVV
jgi:altronate dehydratase small subunit